MQIVLLPRTYDVGDWIALLTALKERYPDAGVLPRPYRNNAGQDDARTILVVPEHEMTFEDSEFLNSLSRPYLIRPSDMPDEMYQKGRNRKWLMDDWYGLNNSSYDNT